MIKQRNAVVSTFSFVAIALGTLGGSPISATTSTANLTVTASVLGACSVSVPGSLGFGTIDTTVSTSVDQTATVNVTCRNTTAFTLTANGGATGNILGRVLTNGTSTIAYQIYTDSARTTVFGDGTTGSNVSGTGTGATISQPIYGRITGSRAAATPGNYADTVVLTVTY